MMKYQVIKHIDTIKEWSYMDIQLNLIKWGDIPAKYDIRKWEGEEPRKGISLSKEESEALLFALAKELGYQCTRIKQDQSEEQIPFGLTDDNSDENYSEPVVIDYRNFVVHSNISECEKNNHEYEDITAVVPLMSKGYGSVKTVEFPARFCKTCKTYYISEFTYNKLKNQGRLLCQVASLQEYKEYTKAKLFGDLKPQNILNIIGYNVDAKNGLSDSQRRTILMYAIEEGVVSKKEAINHISFLIKLNEKTNKLDALQKWKSDRDYLQGYAKGSKQLIGVNRILKEKDVIEP